MQNEWVLVWELDNLHFSCLAAYLTFFPLRLHAESDGLAFLEKAYPLQIIDVHIHVIVTAMNFDKAIRGTKHLLRSTKSVFLPPFLVLHFWGL